MQCTLHRHTKSCTHVHSHTQCVWVWLCTCVHVSGCEIHWLHVYEVHACTVLMDACWGGGLSPMHPSPPSQYASMNTVHACTSYTCSQCISHPLTCHVHCTGTLLAHMYIQSHSRTHSFRICKLHLTTWMPTWHMYTLLRYCTCVHTYSHNTILFLINRSAQKNTPAQFLFTFQLWAHFMLVFGQMTFEILKLFGRGCRITRGNVVLQIYAWTL